MCHRGCGCGCVFESVDASMKIFQSVPPYSLSECGIQRRRRWRWPAEKLMEEKDIDWLSLNGSCCVVWNHCGILRIDTVPLFHSAQISAANGKLHEFVHANHHSSLLDINEFFVLGGRLTRQ